MRLNERERSAIFQAATEVFSQGTCVSLFGSRTDDTRRGGDIDLLVETQQSLPAAQWVAQRSRFVARIWRLLGERRIDVVLATQNETDDRQIVQQARKVAIPLAVVK
jgi:predicted nucleotidyltransferase